MVLVEDQLCTRTRVTSFQGRWRSFSVLHNTMNDKVATEIQGKLIEQGELELAVRDSNGRGSH